MALPSMHKVKVQNLYTERPLIYAMFVILQDADDYADHLRKENPRWIVSVEERETIPTGPEYES